MKKGKSFLIGISGLLLGVVLVLTLHGKATLALFSDQENVVNTGKAGLVQTQVEEKVEGLKKLDIKVRNTGTADAYVRMAVKMPEKLPEGLSLTTVKSNSSNWTDGGDGYFYYNEILAAGVTTENLYDAIYYLETVPGTLDKVSPDTLQIVIYSEAIQSAHVDLSTCKDGCRTAAQKAFKHFK